MDVGIKTIFCSVGCYGHGKIVRCMTVNSKPRAEAIALLEVALLEVETDAQLLIDAINGKENIPGGS